MSVYLLTYLLTYATLICTFYYYYYYYYYWMLESHRLVAITEVWHIVTKLHEGCLCTVHCTAVLIKLKLVPRLWQYKEYGIYR